MYELIDGLILSDTVVKERDKFLTVLTAKYGKISVYARNVRSLRRGSLAYTLPFQFCRLEIQRRTSGITLSQGEIIISFLDISNDLERFALGQYVLDIAKEMTVENSDESDMLRLTLNTLYMIREKKKPLPLIKATFEFRAMVQSGYLPNLDGCDLCGGESEEMFFDIMNGRVICRECQRIRNSEAVESYDTGTAVIVVQITPTILRALRYVISCEPNRIFSYSIAEDELRDYADVCEKYILNHLERGFSTLDFYHEVTNI